MVSKNHKNVCKVLNCIEHLLILVSAVTGCVSISAFASLLCIAIGIASSAVGLRTCMLTAAIKIISQKLRKREKSMIKIK